MNGYLVVANSAAAGTAEGTLEEAMRLLGDDGPVECVETSASEEVDDVLDRLDGRTLVVAGGDGSLHVVLERLHVRGELARVSVGLVPLGTGNDFARAVGLPLEPEDAVRTIIGGRPRPVDLLLDDTESVVVNCAHGGVGAEAADKASGLKRLLGPLAYPAGAVAAGASAPRWTVRVEADDELAYEGELLLVAVANGPTVGGGTALCPRARVDDGSAEVVIVTATALGDRAAFAAALASGSHLERDDVTCITARDVRVTGEPIPWNTDGEIGDPVTRRSLRLEPAAWRLVR